MPKDSKGGFHLNTQRAMAADKHHGAASSGPNGPNGHAKKSAGGRHMTIHDHGDGSFHSDDSDGAREEHPDAMAVQDHVGQWAAGDGNQSDEMEPPAAGHMAY